MSDTDPDDPTNWQQVNQTQYERDSPHDLGTTIIYAVAEVESKRPTDLGPPLYDVIDATAVETSLFQHSPAGTGPGAERMLEFRYDDYRIRVRSDGWVFIYEHV